ncbi:MAG: nucleotide exchange factor GrpE [Pseudomonadota bacterium]
MQDQEKINEAIPTADSHNNDSNAQAENVTAATSATPPDSMPSLEETLRQAELNAAEHHDAWLRAKAETENVRRRALEDVAKASKFAVEKFATELLAVRDSLEAALATPTPTVDSLKSGTELTLKQLLAAFEKSGLVEINPMGEKFDPHRHQAISAVESEQVANTVVNVLQKGCLLADRVLRPALVTVAKAKA